MENLLRHSYLMGKNTGDFHPRAAPFPPAAFWVSSPARSPGFAELALRILGGLKTSTYFYCDPTPAFCPRIDRAQTATPLSLGGYFSRPSAFGPGAYPHGRVDPLRVGEGQWGFGPQLFNFKTAIL